MRRLIVLLLFVTIFTGNVFAQDTEMADTMRSNGKIYVLLSIILVVLFGLIGYLIAIDRKATRIEKRIPGRKA